MKFVDTHAHIHFDDYKLDPDEVLGDARKAGVEQIIAVGCDIPSSAKGVEFAKTRENVYCAVGVHPHYAKKFFALDGASGSLEALLKNPAEDKIVAIGEFGLDYFYEHSPKSDQIKLLKLHLEQVQKYDLPAIFHIRDAFEDFWPVFDEFHSQKTIRGVVHCFTATEKEASEAVERGLYVALNGIMTFTKDPLQLAAAKTVPLDRLLLETDAPFLTPKPLRGTICKPEHIVLTAEFLSGLRGDKLEQIAEITTKNAQKLFNLS